MQTQAAVKMRNITKRFGPVLASDKAWLDIYRGEVLALLGENGSGKTTLMNMLAGIYYPDDGQIFIDDREVSIRSPKDAYALGIGMIHQHFKLVDVLTAAENIVLGLRDGRHDLKAASQKIRKICETYGFDVDPNQKIYDMSVSQKQTVEIVKVLYRGADILILDEPTAVLTPQEANRLFAVLRNMRDDGKAVVIITHKLHEVLDVSDRVAILRRGCFVGDMLTKNTNAREMTNMMVGHAVTLNIERRQPVDPQPRLIVEDLTVRDGDGVVRLDGASFTLCSGEVLGVAGISGSGQRELLEAIAGLHRAERGSVRFLPGEGSAPEELLGRSPLDILHMGVSLSFVPEDRLGMGLVGSMDLTDNMMLRSFRDGKGVFADRRHPRELAGRVVKELSVNTPGLSIPVRRLSGGNVQKVLVGREIAAAPKVLMTAYATRGLDINSSYTIYDLVNRQKEKGVAVLYVGEDLDVLLELCDRILVLCAGRINGIVDGRAVTKEQVGMLMTSLQEGAESHG